MTKFPCQVSPNKRESIKSYLLRLAEANFYPSPLWLNNLQGFPEYLDQIIGFGLYGRLPSWLSVNKNYAHMPNGLSDYFVQADKTRFCPQCVKESGIWRLEWEHAFYSACHYHHIKILDSCASCRKNISWKRGRLSYCQCGADLTTVTSVPAEAIEVAFCHLIAVSINCDGGDSIVHLEANNLPINLYGISASSLASLIYVSGAHARDDKKQWSPKLCKISKLQEASVLVKSAATLFVNWPANFHAFLRRYGEFDTPDACNHKPPLAFKRFSKSILSNFGGDLGFVQTAYREFIRDHWLGVLSHRQHWATDEDRDNQRFISGIVSARILGISNNQIKKLLDKKILCGYFRTTKGGRIFTYVERSSLTGAESYLGDSLYRNNIVQMLGISDKRINELITAGLLITHSKNSHSQNITFSRSEVTAMVKKLSSHIRELGQEERTISAQTILRARLNSNGEFSMFVQAVLDGKLSVVGLDGKYKGLSALIFSLYDFIVWQKAVRIRPKDRLTVIQIADVLEVKEEVVYHLLRSGLLPSKITTLWGRRQYEVQREDMLLFQQKYISGVTLASNWSTSANAVLQILRARDISPIAGPTVDGCRQYFFRRSDV